MSDYVGNLAQRAVSQEAAIQPRPVSPFSSYSSSGFLGAIPPWDWAALFEEEAWQELEDEAPAEVTTPSSQNAAPITFENLERAADAAPASMIMTKIEQQLPPAPASHEASLREYPTDYLAPAPHVPLPVSMQDKVPAPPRIFEAAFLREPAIAADPSPIAPNVFIVKKEMRNSEASALPTSTSRELHNISAESPRAPNHTLQTIETSRLIVEALPTSQENPLRVIETNHDALPTLHEIGVAPSQSEEGKRAVNRAHEYPAETRPELREVAVTVKQPQADHPQIVAANILQPYVEAARSSLQNTPSSESPSAAPTIRVNIGRIEVRAVTPPNPTPRPKRAAAAPRLSLDEYLKQRSGGQR